MRVALGLLATLLFVPAGTGTEPQAAQVLFVVGNTTLTTADAAVKTRLEGLGYQVVVKAANASVTADATGKALVVVSSTVTPSHVGTKFRTVAVPVLLWESQLYDEFGMCGSGSADQGTVNNQTQVTIVDAGHPMAAGKTGNVAVATASGRLSWGNPNANGEKVATIVGNANRATIFGYRTGQPMPGLAAPSRRVGLFMEDATAATWTADGRALFDAAVQWAVAPEPPPPAPTNLTATGGTGQAVLTWTAAPSAATYTVKRSTSPGGPYSPVATNVGTTTHTDPGLTNGTTYYYVVSGTNVGGEGPDSTETSAAPIAAPSGLSAMAGTSQVNLSWTPVSGATAYTVKRSTTSGSGYAVRASGLTATTYQDTPAVNGTAYFYVVTATAPQAESSNSNEAPGTPIAVPANLARTNLDRAVSLTWSAASGASAYTVKRSNTSGGPYTPVATNVTQTSHTDTGLTNGTTYYYVVSGTNPTGESGNSSQVSGTPEGAPPPPATVTAVASEGAVTLTWTAVPGATSYNVKRLSADGTSYVTIASGVTLLTHPDTGLTNGTPYRYAITSRAGVFESEPSVQAVATPIARPTNLTARPGHESITLTWGAAPGAVTYSILQGTSPGGPYSPLVDVQGTVRVVTGLTNGTPYYFVVRGVNPSGTGNLSAEATATPTAPPAAPAGLSAVAGTSRVSLAWSAAAGATGYVIKRGTTPGGPYQEVATVTGASAHEDVTAVDGTPYVYVVCATGPGGESGASNEAGATPIAIPGGLKATAGDGQVTLTWSAAPGATTYTVRHASAQGGPFTDLVSNLTGTTHVDPGLTNGVPRFYVVRGVNPTGQGLVSGIAHATPLAPPGPPTNLAAQPGGGGVRLSWTAGPWASTYTVRQATALAGPYAIVQAGVAPTETLLTGLSAGTTYYFVVRSVNAAGESADSAPASIAIAGGPPGSAPPVNWLAQQILDGSSIRWIWTDVGDDDGYRLHGAGEQVVATIPRDSSSYVETGLPENAAIVRHLHAYNAFGDGPPSQALDRVTGIHTPTTADFVLESLSATEIRVTVTPPANGMLGNTGVQIGRSTDGLNWTLVRSFQNAYTWTDTGLSAGTRYFYRISFRNQDERYVTPWSPDRALPPLGTPTTPPAASTLSVIRMDPTSLRFTWTDLPDEASYVLHDASHAQAGSTGADVMELTQTLPENTLIVRHLHGVNSAGEGAASNEVSMWTHIPHPSTADFSLQALSSTQIRVVVRTPANPTLNNTSCLIQRLSFGGWADVKPWSSVYTFDDGALEPGRTYTYRFLYRAADGTIMIASPVREATTPPASPIPNGFRAVAATTSTVTWAWDDVDGETGFVLRSDVGGSIGSVGAGILSFQELSLPENSRQVRRVHALMPTGEGQGSDEVAAYTLVRDALASDVQLSLVSASRIAVNVAPPSNAYGHDTGCEIERSANGTSWQMLKPFSSVYRATDDPVPAGQTMYYRARYRNGDGVPSAWSPAVSAASALPPAAANVAGTAQSASSILWSWDPVQGATGYVVHDGSENSRGSAGPDLPVLLESGLLENEPYVRHVHALNGLGEGSASAAATRRTWARTPGADDFTLKAVGTTAVDVSVLPPRNPSEAAVEVQRSPDGNSWATVQPFAANYLFGDTGLTALSSYHYRIRFQNGDGVETPWSPSKAVVTVPSPTITTPPKKIRSQTIAVQGTTVSGVQSVRVYFNGVDKGAANVAGSTWTFSSNNNPEGTYSVTAKATVSGVPSDPSAAVEIRVDLTAPSAVTDVRVRAYNNAIDVEWAPSAAVDLAGYLVYRKTGAGGTWALLNTTGVVRGTRYRDSTAVTGTTYFYKVAAVDDALPN